MHTTHFIGLAADQPAGHSAEHFADQSAIQMAYHDLNSLPPGTAERTPFCLVHGFTGGKLDFADHLPWLAASRRTIAYDQRGHGETSNQGPYTEQRYVADLIALLDALEIERCDLLGHSFGGMIAMRAALEHPDRFRSLILMDTSAGPLDLFSVEVKSYLDGIVAEQGCAGLLDGMRGVPATVTAQRGIDFLGETEHWRRIQTKLEQMDPEAFREVGGCFGTRPDLTASLRALSCPLTVIVGGEDKPFLEPSRTLAGAVTDAVLEVIPGAGHSPQFENAASWRAAIEGHFDRIKT